MMGVATPICTHENVVDACNILFYTRCLKAFRTVLSGRFSVYTQ